MSYRRNRFSRKELFRLIKWSTNERTYLSKKEVIESIIEFQTWSGDVVWDYTCYGIGTYKFAKVAGEISLILPGGEKISRREAKL